MSDEPNSWQVVAEAALHELRIRQEKLDEAKQELRSLRQLLAEAKEIMQELAEAYPGGNVDTLIYDHARAWLEKAG